MARARPPVANWMYPKTGWKWQSVRLSRGIERGADIGEVLGSEELWKGGVEDVRKEICEALQFIEYS